ncbi:uncharacterized protein [Narcine bancroftii]|uniref:uncharacterized protein n=1 Tax=Narcine bancroftii TaxID=1343680 RepID=UPI003831498D
MEKNGAERASSSRTEPSNRTADDSLECFICREPEMTDRDLLLQFCDCKSLVAHHKCLLTWIQKSHWSEKSPRCKVCMVEYHLQNGSAWRMVAVRWQNWLILTITLGLVALVPFIVYWMMTAFSNPPPHFLFKAAAVCFGLLSETLLIKFLIYYLSSRYSRAKMSSFSIRERTLEKGDSRVNLLRLPGQTPTAAALSRTDASKSLGLYPHVEAELHGKDQEPRIPAPPDLCSKRKQIDSLGRELC